MIVRARTAKETDKTIEIAIDDNPETASNITEQRLISDPKLEYGDKQIIRFAAGEMGIIIKLPKKITL